MAKFSEVFGTTLKVLAALAIISVVGGVIYAVIVGLRETSNSGSASSTAKDASTPDQYDKAADERHTTVPESKWNSLVEQGIKQHCAFRGMSKDDVTKVLGKATHIDTFELGDMWTYVSEDKTKCLRYNGEVCAQYDERKDIVDFSPTGHVKLSDTGSGCLNEPLFSRLLELPD